MFCKHCGKKIDEDSLFCNFCGKSLRPQVGKDSTPIDFTRYQEGISIAIVSKTTFLIVSLIGAIICSVLFFVDWFSVIIVGNISIYQVAKSVFGSIAYWNGDNVSTEQIFFLIWVLVAILCALLYIVYVLKLINHLTTKNADMPPSADSAAKLSIFLTIVILIFAWYYNYSAQQDAENVALFSGVSLFKTTAAPWIILIISVILTVLQRKIDTMFETVLPDSDIDEANSDDDEAEVEYVPIKKATKQGFSEISKGYFSRAELIFKNILKQDSHSAMAWRGLLMVSLQCRNSNEIKKLNLDISNRKEYINAVKYADDVLMQQFESIKDEAMAQDYDENVVS